MVSTIISELRVRRELRESGARLVPKDNDILMWMIGFILPDPFMTRFWTTYRLPFMRARICYPPSVRYPGDHWGIIDHELVHVKQFAPPWGPLWVLILATLLPLPALFSGRWYIERRAYLKDILAGRRTIDDCVRTLWAGYGMPWPKSWMKAWFTREVDLAGAPPRRAHLDRARDRRPPPEAHPMKSLVFFIVSGCGHIPGTDVAIPPEWHNGGRLAACYPNEGRHKAICLYAGPASLVAWCTFDGGRRWEACKNEDVMPSAQHPGHDTGGSI